MKKTTLFFALVYALLFACSDDDQLQLQEKEKVQFDLAIASDDPSNGRVSRDIPSGSVAAVEIAGPAGTITEKLEILHFGESYLTAPLELPTGSHQLVSFMIVSEDNEVLYAAPKEGSTLAAWVNNALPQSFNVHKGKVRNLPVQVIAVDGKTPETFGYASFGIEVVKPITITAFIEQNGTLIMTDASGYIQAEGVAEPLQQIVLSAKMNHLNFTGEDDQSYFILIDKAGYKSGYKTFTYSELGETPSISVVLEKISDLRIDAQAWEEEGPWDSGYNLEVKGTGSITVDWGDGTIETWNFNPGLSYHDFYHVYDADLRSAGVTISGDLDKITSFVGTNGRYHNLDVMPNLEGFTDFRSDINPIAVEQIDLSKNFRLRSLSLEEANYTMILGENKVHLIQFWFRGNFRENQIIPALASHITENNLYDGMIEFFYVPNPVSEENMGILRGLRASHGWYIGFDYEGI
jgi:hypothetical protein